MRRTAIRDWLKGSSRRERIRPLIGTRRFGAET